MRFLPDQDVYDELARQFPAANRRHLSMGMTDDFEVAVEEGATLVRIGGAIFGRWKQLDWRRKRECSS